jgi:hypothetical protein
MTLFFPLQNQRTGPAWGIGISVMGEEVEKGVKE